MYAYNNKRLRTEHQGRNDRERPLISIRAQFARYRYLRRYKLLLHYIKLLECRLEYTVQGHFASHEYIIRTLQVPSEYS